MSRTLVIDALGAAIEIDGSALTEIAWQSVLTAWQDARTDTRAAPTATVIAHGTVPPPTMLAGLSVDVTLAALKQRAGDLLLLHAAGLAMPDGRVIALVGPSGRGKTTAARVLGSELGYVSDETVGIAADGTVMPYRKPLSLIEHASHVKVQRSPSELGLRPLADPPLRLAALVLLERNDRNSEPRLEKLDLAEAIASLAQQASYLGRMPRPLLTIRSHVESIGGVHRIAYSDVSTLVPVLSNLAADVAVPPPREIHDQTPDTPTPDNARGRFGGASGPTYRRVQPLDAVVLEDERLLLLVRLGEYSTRVFVLDGIAPTLWNASADPVTVAELVAATVDRHGAPIGQDATESVTATLDQLADAGIIVRV